MKAVKRACGRGSMTMRMPAAGMPAARIMARWSQRMPATKRVMMAQHPMMPRCRSPVRSDQEGRDAADEENRQHTGGGNR